MRRYPPVVILLFAALSGVLPAGQVKTDKTKPRHTNRLARETSPYLLMHKHNPVDWYPWGPEAFAKAKKENKLVFVSIGYSSCYWCHVMERESFSNAAVAKLLNDWFVAVKVDREERPDIDHIYMTALQTSGRGGGWPLSMFLTPDGRPVVGAPTGPPRIARTARTSAPASSLCSGSSTTSGKKTPSRSKNRPTSWPRPRPAPWPGRTRGWPSSS